MKTLIFATTRGLEDYATITLTAQPPENVISLEFLIRPAYKYKNIIKNHTTNHALNLPDNWIAA